MKKLFPGKKRYSSDITFSMRTDISARKHRICTVVTQFIYYFFLCSIGGFLWEVLVMLYKTGGFCNRGFLYGPWLPVYGTGAVLFYIILGKLKSHPVAVFLLSMLLGGAIELGAGWLLDNIWNLRYWNYSDKLLNVNGYICLYSVVAFGIAGIAWICLLSRLSYRIWHLLPRKLRNVLLTLLILAFIADCAASLIYPNTGSGITF